MRKKRQCPQCGAERTDDAMSGLCPRCLARYSFLELEGEMEPAQPAKGPRGTIQVNPETDLELERTGLRIGRYKLLEQIGEGGFGLVYMAEQIEPIQRKVALKIIKAGMDTRAVVARFEAERQALALMDHPNIARVLDAGTTQAGRPYFVMELVRGIPITEFCDQKRLSTPQRLELFITVCHAVQHAHQKGIIHRDLKPSNVLVTLHDGKPVPKVIDFGVAKALGQRLTEKTLFTGFAQMIGTPAYMSPEQAEMSGLDVDTRSDIYSLGVLFYELLIGVTPFDRDTLAKAALDEIRRMIRETEPPKPSTRLQTLGERMTSVAQSRHTDGPKLVHLVQGDLDWIVMKCLEKDRTRRYETANGLAMDVQRHLNTEPVTARPPSKLYEFQKTVRRHKFGFAAAGGVMAALLIGLGVSTWQFLEKSRAYERASAAEQEQIRLRESAEKEAAKATAISDFLQGMLQAANPDEHRGLDYTVRELLGDFSEGLSDQFTDQPEVKVALHSTMGRAYWRLALPEKALAHHQKALALRQELYGSNSTEVGESHADCAWALYDLRERGVDPAQAETHIHEALAIYRPLGDSEREGLINALRVYQRWLGHLQRFDEGDAALEEALAVLPPGIDHPTIAAMMTTKAYGLVLQGQYREAEAVSREALALHRRTRGTNDLEIAWALHNLALTLREQGKSAELRQPASEALAMFREVLPFDSDPVVWASYTLEVGLRDSGDWRGLETLLLQRLADRRAPALRGNPDGGRQDAEVIGTLFKLAHTVEKQGRDTEAITYRREANRVLSEMGVEDPNTARTLIEAGNSLMWDPGTSVQAHELLLKGYQALKAHGSSTEGLDTFGLALILRYQGELLEAERFLRQTMVSRGSDNGGAAYRMNPLKELATLLRNQGRTNEAEGLYLEELQSRKERFGENAQMVSEWLFEYAAFLSKAGRVEEAYALADGEFSRQKSLLGEDDPRIALWGISLGKLLLAQGKLTNAATLFLQGAEHADPKTLNGLAWSMATSPIDENRDGPISVELSQKAVAATQRKNLEMLDTLAAAYAEAEQFPDAVEIQLEAIALVPEPDSSLGKDFEYRLRLYQSNLPFRDYWHEANQLREAGKLDEAETLLRKELEQRRKMHEPEDPTLARCLAILALVLIENNKFVEAEPYADECLKIREQQLPDNWLTFNARSLLGGCLLGQKRYEEAESLLLSGYEGMAEQAEAIPKRSRYQVMEFSIQRLVALYEAMDNFSQAESWRQKIAEIDSVTY